MIFDYRCARCWSPLIERDGEAVCARDIDGTLGHRGYHRLSGIEWQKAHSEQDKHEVMRLYQDLTPYNYMLGLAKPPTSISAEQLSKNRRALGRDDSGL